MGESVIMTSPGKLRDFVADVFGQSDQIETIDVHLRNLREANLIAKAKRGRGAAEVGPADAAHLILAVAGSVYVKDSVKSVRTFGELSPDIESITVLRSKNLRERFSETAGFELPSGKTFGLALQRVLSLAAKGELLAIPRYGRDRRDRTYLSMRLYHPYEAASLHFGVNGMYDVNQTYGKLPLSDPRNAWDLRAFRCEGQLLSVRVIDLTAIVRIGKLVDTASSSKNVEP